jgi:HPt (histidine-containing phosphotransfer) domain-containing protein
MATIPGNVEWVSDLIPDLESQLDPFIVDTDEVDEELVDVFIEELRRLTGELKDGMQNSDDEMVRMAAHSIKGMGGTIGLPEISVVGPNIENAAKEDRLRDAQPLVDALVNWQETLG